MTDNKLILDTPDGHLELSCLLVDAPEPEPLPPARSHMHAAYRHRQIARRRRNRR